MNLLTLLLFLFCPAPVSADEVDSFLNAYYLAEGKLSDFDKELFQSRDADFLARSRPYRDLLALRVMLEEKAEKFGRAVLKHSEANVPLHTLLKKAAAYKNHPKFNLSDAEFEL